MSLRLAAAERGKMLRKEVEDCQVAGSKGRFRAWARKGQRQTQLLLPGPWGPRVLVCFNYQLQEVQKVRDLASSAFPYWRRQQ